MSVHAPHPVKTAGTGDCGCGCGGTCGCESRCCELECLVRPRFFCGQLLTDADLGVMVDWTRSRFALERYRDGWGVVCGLDVTCTSPRGGRECCPSEAKGPTVWVGPGYAVDCCGNDLVVCEPLSVDLAAACAPLDDPCDETTKPKPNGKPAQGKGGRIKTKEGIATGIEDCFDLGRDLVAADLYLRYHEDLAQGQRSLFRGDCSDVGTCEYSRILETPCAHVEPISVDLRKPHNEDAETEDWWTELRMRQQTFLHELREILRRGPDLVLQYLRRRPPFYFCFLEDVVCCLKGQADLGSDWVDRVGFWLYYDWLLHELKCPCPSCKPDPGVRLARVYLRREHFPGGDRCRVVMIDTSGSHRRPLRKDECRPTPRGKVDLVPYLWEGPDSLDRLGSQGMVVKAHRVKTDSDLLSAVHAGLPHAEAGVPLSAIVMRDPFGHERIAAFRYADKEKE